MMNILSLFNKKEVSNSSQCNCKETHKKEQLKLIYMFRVHVNNYIKTDKQERLKLLKAVQKMRAKVKRS